MNIIMKTLCIFGIPNQHNIHDLKNRRYCSSTVAQVHVHKLPTAHKAPKRPACTEQVMPYPTSPRVCQLPKGAGACLAGLNKVFFGTWFWWISAKCGLAPVTALARIAQTGSNVAWWFYLLHGARDARVCWNQTNMFWFMVCQKLPPKPNCIPNWPNPVKCT